MARHLWFPSARFHWKGTECVYDLWFSNFVEQSSASCDQLLNQHDTLHLFKRVFPQTFRGHGQKCRKIGSLLHAKSGKLDSFSCFVTCAVITIWNASPFLSSDHAVSSPWDYSRTKSGWEIGTWKNNFCYLALLTRTFGMTNRNINNKIILKSDLNLILMLKGNNITFICQNKVTDSYDEDFMETEVMGRYPKITLQCYP